MDRFICPSRFAQDQAIGFGLPAGRVRTKAHFLHPEPEPATAHGGDALFLGRVDEVKGADLLIEAWREVPGLSLTVVGDGPIRARLERVVAERGNVNIRFAGQLSYDRCQELLRDAGLLVFPSRGFETFGLALRDAMAFGKPILASRRGAAAELIEHETSGLLFEPDSPADLASEARRLHGDVELRQRLGRGARAKFEKLMRDGPAYRKLIEIYEEAQVQRQR